MKSLLDLWMVLTQELGEMHCVSTGRDIKTAAARYESEGFSFLTITLPDFSKGLEKALAEGQVRSDHLPGFRFSGGLPLFLGGFLERIFRRKTGVLLDNPDHSCIWAVRQITRFLGKVEMPCSEERTLRSFAEFVRIDSGMASLSDDWREEDLKDLNRVFRLVFGGATARVDALCAQHRLVPNHGPGRTADRLDGNAKFRQYEWPERLEASFPSSLFLIPNFRFVPELEEVKPLSPGEERPVKVTSVPKTLKTPRIIAVEPTCMQYTQQAIKVPLVEQLEMSKTSRPFVGFTDQEPNRVLARTGSLDGSLSTLDLSEASDRVSNDLVKILFKPWVHLHDAIQASRSTRAIVPRHGEIHLSKFASMGSALTFPIEAMVFCAIVLLGVERARGIRLTEQALVGLRGRVRVYGDDIICPVDSTQSVIELLETFGFKVNTNKSFWSGSFRESCGKDWYAGTDVSVVKCRSRIPTSRRHVEEIRSTVALRNNLAKAGLVRTVEWLDQRLVRVLKHFPFVAETSPVLGRHDAFRIQPDRVCEDHHIPLVKGWMTSDVIPSSNLDGMHALLKCLLKQDGLPFVDAKHLERAGRPRVASMKLGYGSAL